MASAAGRIGKSELLSRLRARRDQIAGALATIPEPLFLRPGIIGRWSVRDLLAHLVAHEQRALGEIAAARRGERQTIDHAAVDEFNAGAALAWAALGRDEAVAVWERSHAQVVAMLRELAETDLAPGSALERTLDDTVDGALANNTYAHYAEHLAELEAVARLGSARSGSG